MNHKCSSHHVPCDMGSPATCSRSTWGPPLPAQEVHGVPCHLPKEHMGSHGPSSAPRGEKWCVSKMSTADGSPRCAVPFPWLHGHRPSPGCRSQLPQNVPAPWHSPVPKQRAGVIWTAVGHSALSGSGLSWPVCAIFSELILG